MAADLTQTFIGKHVEKVVVAAAAVIFIGAIAWFVGMREPQDDLRRQVSDDVKKLEGTVGEERTLPEVLTPEERVTLGIGLPGTTVAGLRHAVEGLPGEVEVSKGPVLVPPVPKTTIIIVNGFAQTPPKEVLAVQQVTAAMGFGVTSQDVPKPQATLKTSSGAFHDVVWAGCVGKFDLTEQWKIYTEPYRQYAQTTGENIEPPADPNCPVAVSRVELRRREQKPDGTWSDWEVVPATTSAEAAKAMPAPPADPRDTRDVRGRWYPALTKNQAAIRRAPFYPIVAPGEGQTVAELAGPVEGVAQPALQPVAARPASAATAAAAPAATAAATPAPAATSTSPFGTPFTQPERPGEGPFVTPPPEMEHLFATVWASDATVEPGKTYQYQMRVAIVNPVWSLPGVEDEQARWTLELAGQWSDPTEPVIIPELMQFYFVGTFGDRVNLELHRWIHGVWIVAPSVPRYVGGPVIYTKDRARIPVPGKNETVAQDVTLDLNVFLVDVIRGFQYQPGGRNQPISANVLLFADPKGNLQRRIDWEDQKRAANDRLKRKQAAE
ncbi:MAG: hypothetical protein ISS74_01405 [Planctomycetes bacterium]|nr:hypothetical protein [Planctomycetota bacterium]